MTDLRALQHLKPEGVRDSAWIKSCASKVRYASESAATRRAVRLAQKYGTKQRAYPCRMCIGWHLTTKEEVMHHACPIKQCLSRVPSNKLMCSGHWNRVPQQIQRDVYAAYRTYSAEVKVVRMSGLKEVLNAVTALRAAQLGQ